MSKKKKRILPFLYLLVFFSIVFYTYRVRSLTDDELYNYGYAVSILSHQVPYKDFSMIVPPTSAYLTAFFLLLFGKKLMVYHCLLAGLITTIFILGLKKIGYFILPVCLLILFYPYAGYNILSLFGLFAILFFRENPRFQKWIPLIIVLMFTTKQTLALLIIPSLIEAQNKKRSILIYILSLFLFLFYFLYFNNLSSFLNYCFGGMLDFTTKNKTPISILTKIEFLILFFLAFSYWKTKRIEYFYVLTFQIITFPIVDYFHFCLSLSPVVYLILEGVRKHKMLFYYCFIFFTTIALTLHLVVIIKTEYQAMTTYPVKNFMEGRLCSSATPNLIQNIQNQIEESNAKKVYILGNFSYLVKLNSNLKIDAYDNINKGNLGYHGEEKVKQKIITTCKNTTCLFIFNESEANGQRKSQTSKTILNEIKKNYIQYYSSSNFDLYNN